MTTKMRTVSAVCCSAVLTLCVITRNADAVPCYGVDKPVCVFYDDAPFEFIGGPLNRLDFETLPDGSPSYTGALITPDFNYTAQGVTFTSPIDFPQIAGRPGGHTLEVFDV